MERLNKKGQAGGLVTSLVFGIAALVIAVIIALVITSTLSGAGLLTSDRDLANGVTNESGWLNNTGYTLGQYGATSRFNFVITGLTNETHKLGAAGNYTLTAGVLKNATVTYSVDNVRINYTYDIYSPEELQVTQLTSNFTGGIGNVSSKIPTILLIAAIVLILGTLAVLVGVWQKMRMGSGSI